MNAPVTRDDLATRFFEQLPYPPYPVQEEALLTWFTSERGVLVCAPTGTGKTLIAQGALFEALHSGRTAYYTTPLIALTDQKFQEIQAAAVSWGFRPDDVGLVTGNRKVNPDAKVLVVVAEILLNRLLHESAFDFSQVSAVVMDEFHSFNDPERGIVWELSLGLLPPQVRLMLLSATVGNTAEFLMWLQRAHGRRLDLVQGTERKVPLRYTWVGDEFLNEQIEFMARGDEATRKTPTLVFCFNRDECWNVADQLRGRNILAEGQQDLLAKEMQRHDWSQGVGPKMKTLLLRGVGVHHAGVLPKYKRIVEDLFVRKMLSVCVCTETLSAGMNLPARSVLMVSLMKGPWGKCVLIDPSIAHQIFGRAGRPQFDTEGYVYALAHEDDVRIARYQERMDQIPEDTRDPLLIKKRKQMKKKMPKRRQNVQYWGDEHFQKLIAAPPTQLRSQGPLPWRLLVYLLSLSPEVSRVRQAISKRLMDPKTTLQSQRRLVDMLLALEDGGYVTLSPPRPNTDEDGATSATESKVAGSPSPLSTRLRALAAEGRFDVNSRWDGEYVDPSDSMAPTADEFLEDEFGVGLVDDVAATLKSEADATEPEVADVVGNSIGSGARDSGSDEEAEPVPDASAPGLIRPGEIGSPSEPGLPVVESKTASHTLVPAKLSSSMKFLLEAQGVKISGQSKGAGPKLVRDDEPITYEPTHAYPTESLTPLLTFRSINPVYGMFLLDVLPLCDGPERVQALESVLGFPRALVKALRIPRAEILPPSAFTQEFLNVELLQRGLASLAELSVGLAPDQEELPPEERIWPLTFPDKLMRMFHFEFPHVADIPLTPVWAAGELLHFGGDFNKLITTRKIARQEGILFRHVLRFVLLVDEFVAHVPAGTAWHDELVEICERLTASCRAVDPYSTDQMIESAKAGDIIESEIPI